MFGLVVSGRPVITEFQAVSQTQFAFSVAPGFSHLCVFLLPGQVLPQGAAAAVYIRLTPSSDYKLLGAIANEKQSAIFKVREPAASSANNTASGDDLMLDDDISAQSSGAEVVVGISIESAENVQQQLAARQAQSASQSTALVPINNNNNIKPDTKLLAQRIIKNAFNFLSSFGDTVPLKSFENWWHKFEKKIELDPTFLERED